MKLEQTRWSKEAGWTQTPGTLGANAQLVLLFGSTSALEESGVVQEIRRAYPRAHLLGCSTAGEICGTQVTDDTLVSTAVEFEHTQLKGSIVHMKDMGNSFDAGERLAQSLEGGKDLAHVFVLSDGLKVNGSDLVRGLTKHLPADVTVTGGLSGDGGRFQKTLVMLDGAPAQDSIAAIALFGKRLKVGYGSLGGWDPFGPERLITRSKANVLYEMDGKSALALYKEYLGDHASGLPATGLLYPLAVRTSEGDTPVVRTILAVDEKEQSMTFAGDVPEGAHAQLMKANFDRLIDGATGAAKTCHEAVGARTPDLAILISCVGRKMVLKQRIEEEVESVRDVLGNAAVLAGFYSYGEISPFTPSARCELHNQTMTITTFSER